MNHTTCYNCGGTYIPHGAHHVCPSCGFVRPEGLSDEELSLLYKAYKQLRLADFTGAAQEFDAILCEYPENAQAYFGRFLAKYRVKYEEGFDDLRCPVCYTALSERVTDSPDYVKALEYADEATLAVYRRHAGYIEHCRADRVSERSARTGATSAWDSAPIRTFYISERYQRQGRAFAISHRTGKAERLAGACVQNPRCKDLCGHGSGRLQG